MIEAAALLSIVVSDWTDFTIILALLVLNAAVGFWEEFQADNAIAALKARLAPVLRPLAVCATAASAAPRQLLSSPADFASPSSALPGPVRGNGAR